MANSNPYIKDFLTRYAHLLDAADYSAFFDQWYANSLNVLFDLQRFKIFADALTECELDYLLPASEPARKDLLIKYLRAELDNLTTAHFFYHGLRLAHEHIVSGLKSTLGFSLTDTYNILESIATSEYNAIPQANFKGQRALVFQ